MVSTFKLAVFMVNVIIAFTLPIVALVKVRRKESVMKFIIIGVVTSFLVTFLQNILLILGAGMFPDLYKQGNTYILTSLLVITQFLALFIVINLLKGKFFKQKMDQQMGLAMTLGYLLNFTFGQVMSHFNYFLAGFAINMGQLSEIFNQEQILYYTTNVVDRSELYYFANIFLMVVAWGLFTKVFQSDFSDKSSQRQAILLLAIYTIVSVLVQVSTLTPIASMVVSLVFFVYITMDFRKRNEH